MSARIAWLLRQLHDTERDLNGALDAWRRETEHTVKAGAMRFSEGVRAEHRRLPTSLISYLRSISLPVLLTAPVIYSMILPLALVDLFATVYQRICFPIYGIHRVPRSRYIVLDRHRLGYLNAIEKLNCLYCGYANGVLAYVREIASGTEQYFCPIKHALAVSGRHLRYSRFLDYGDAKGYRENLERLRKTVDEP
jgi:hypothetical protein